MKSWPRETETVPLGLTARARSIFKQHEESSILAGKGKS